MVPNYPSRKKLHEEINLLSKNNQKYPIFVNLLNDEGKDECLQNQGK